MFTVVKVGGKVNQRSHLTLHLPLQALDDFLLLEESLLELIRSLGLLGGCPGHLAQPPLQQSDLK